jgi:salicylate hydroxylase
MRNHVFQIAGGGIAGLASALAVAKSGNVARVMERAAQFEAVGAGLQLGPNAVRALQKLDAWDVVAPITSSPEAILIKDGRSGKTLRRMELGRKFEQRFGAPYRVALRADLVQALLGVVQTREANSITTGAEFELVEHDRNTALIVADGVWSKTRESLFPAHAAVIASDVIFRSLSQDDGLESEVVLWLYPQGHVVHYVVGGKLNLVAVTQGASPELLYAQACDELRQILSNRDWSQWPAAYVPPLQRWHMDNVVLVGDAAHGTLPYMAQGAAMALEDASALLRVLKDEDDCKKAFAQLSALRVARTRHVHNASLRSGEIYHADGFVAAARNFVLAIAPSHLLDRQMAWIYDGN